jgi:primase-polymerase (primpol)-like protein
LKIFARGTLKKGRKFTAIGAEIYSKGRYFTVTGNVVNQRSVVEDRHAEIDVICQELEERNNTAKQGKAERTSKPSANSTDECKTDANEFPGAQNENEEQTFFGAEAGGAPDMSDDELIARAKGARNGEKFRKLWEGDTGVYGGDVSAADMALCCLLAYWTDCDANRIERLFGISELGKRAKWTNRPDYRAMTINKAVSFVKAIMPRSGTSRRKKKPVKSFAQNVCAWGGHSASGTPTSHRIGEGVCPPAGHQGRRTNRPDCSLGLHQQPTRLHQEIGSPCSWR